MHGDRAAVQSAKFERPYNIDDIGDSPGMPTYTELMRGFEFGPWTVIPERGLIRDGETEQKLEPLVMDVFVVLASHGGEVVSKDQLIHEVWNGRPQTDDVITRCISALRRGLGDEARNPCFIETVQRRGYRVMLPAKLPEPAPQLAASEARDSMRPDVVMIGVGFIAVVLIAWFAIIDRSPPVTEGGFASVAVYPFDCLLEASDSGRHLCFGFAEEAISSLNEVEGVRIVRKRKLFDPAEPVQEDSMVTGSVQIIADNVRIAARLEDARSGIVTWSETFDADRDGIFALQRQVGNGLRGALDDDFVAAPVEAAPVDYAAAEAYALGRYLFEQRDHDRIEEAIAQFEEAVRIDPSYGSAWLGLAYTYSIWPDYDLRIDRWSSFDKALEIIAEGVERDPSIAAAAGTVYGYVYHKQNRWADAMANTLKAINAESPSADDYHWHSRVLASVGRLDESLEYARRGAAVDPEYPVIMSRLAIASFWVNDLDNAQRYFDIANRMELEASIHSLAYSLFLIRTQRFDEAAARAARALEEIDLPADWVEPVFDGIADPAARDAALVRLERLDASGEMPANIIMTLSVLLGDVDRAMRVARGMAGGDSVFEIEIIFIDEFSGFRAHPEFSVFIEEVGLADYWDNAGCRWTDDAVECP
jgi:DNA-binding winged helix-turn-helix (wHTH) protein/TolB-like protein/Tfp pilus assembly protein PilF